MPMTSRDIISERDNMIKTGQKSKFPNFGLKDTDYYKQREAIKPISSFQTIFLEQIRNSKLALTPISLKEKSIYEKIS